MNAQQLVPPLTQNAQQVVPARAAAASVQAMTLYRLADITASGDPNGVGSSNVVAGNQGEYVTMGVDVWAAARIPNAVDIGGSYVEWKLRDTLGRLTTLDLPQLHELLMWWLEQTIPADMYAGVALTAGGVGTIGNAGVFAGVRFAAGGVPEAITMVNAGAGAGWITLTVATGTDALARGIRVALSCGNATANARVSCVPVDASGLRSSTSAAVPGPQSGNFWADGAMTHIALVVGPSTGVGGAGTQTLSLSLRTLLQKLEEVPSSEQRLSATAPIGQATRKRWVFIGDSNTNGTQVDATFGGLTIATTHAGWTVRDAGVNLAIWPAGTTPSVGMLPYLIDALIASPGFDNTGNRYIIRRGTNGADTDWPGTIAGQVLGAEQDVIALGLGDPEVVVWGFGANDAQDALEASQMYGLNTDMPLRGMGQLRRALRVARDLWPNAQFVLLKENSTLGAGGSYPNLAAVAPTCYAAIDALAVEFGADIASGVPAVPQADDIHWSQSAGGGQDQMADRVVAALL